MFYKYSSKRYSFSFFFSFNVKILIIELMGTHDCISQIMFLYYLHFFVPTYVGVVYDEY